MKASRPAECISQFPQAGLVDRFGARYAGGMRALVFLIGIILAAPLLAQEVYRWVDDDGHVHYSDRPREGAEEVVLPKAQTFSAPPVAARSAQPDPGEPFEYDSISVTRPAEEETIWNTANQVEVAVALKPRLRRGDKIMWYLTVNCSATCRRGRQA